MRMRELERRSGIGRETIRYYIREGLLPEPARPKRNVARYSDDHVIRLHAIRRLQEERFLPLSVIKALLNADAVEQVVDTAAFPGLDVVLAERLGEAGPARSLAEVAAHLGMALENAQDLARIGIIEPVRDAAGQDQLSPRDVAILTRWQGLHAAGFTPERGFTPHESRIYVEVVQWLAKEEIRLFYAHMAGAAPPSEALIAAERGITLLNEVLGMMRTRAILAELKSMLQSREGGHA
jgi:DNA-binding transcriptional MerR regulator